MTEKEPPTTERLLDAMHEQVRREANERIMALIALNKTVEKPKDQS